MEIDWYVFKTYGIYYGRLDRLFPLIKSERKNCSEDRVEKELIEKYLDLLSDLDVTGYVLDESDSSKLYKTLFDAEESAELNYRVAIYKEESRKIIFIKGNIDTYWHEIIAYVDSASNEIIFQGIIGKQPILVCNNFCWSGKDCSEVEKFRRTAREEETPDKLMGVLRASFQRCTR